MALRIARLANLILVGKFTDNESYRRYDENMPPFTKAALVSAPPGLSSARDGGFAPFRFTFAGAMCFGAMLLVALTGDGPLPDPTPQEELYERPLELRKRWDWLYVAGRHISEIAELGFSCLGALSQTHSGETA